MNMRTFLLLLLVVEDGGTPQKGGRSTYVPQRRADPRAVIFDDWIWFIITLRMPDVIFKSV